MTNDSDSRIYSEASSAIVRIAEALGIPTSTFHVPAGHADSEAYEVLTLFNSLQCPATRQRCLELLRRAKLSEMKP